MLALQRTADWGLAGGDAWLRGALVLGAGAGEGPQLHVSRGFVLSGWKKIYLSTFFLFPFPVFIKCTIKGNSKILCCHHSYAS